jgi:hypothetical protein
VPECEIMAVEAKLEPLDTKLSLLEESHKVVGTNLLNL